MRKLCVRVIAVTFLLVTSTSRAEEPAYLAELPTFQTGSATAHAVAVSPDGKLIAVAGHTLKKNTQGRFAGYADTDVCVWDLASGKEVARLSGHEIAPADLLFTANSKRLISAGSDSVRVWDLQAKKQISKLPAGTAATYDILAKTPDDRFAVWPNGNNPLNGSADRIVVWDMATGVEVDRFKPRKALIRSIAVSSEGKFVATAECIPENAQVREDIRLWNLANGQEIARLRNEPEQRDGKPYVVGQMAFNRESTRLYALSQDGSMTVWDTTAFKQVARWMIHEGGAKCFALSPDDGALVIGCGRFAARNTVTSTDVSVWDVKAGKERAKFASPALVYRIVFHPDGRRFAAATDDGKARVWDLSKLPAK